MTAVLFGSIGSIVETSEMQRDAFNAAFQDHGLNWHWDRGIYQQMLRSSGGQDRINNYAAARGETVDAAAIHATKSRLFLRFLAGGHVSLRPGVAETLSMAPLHGAKLAFVTTTERATVEAIQAIVTRQTGIEFDHMTWRTPHRASKPAPDVYFETLKVLNRAPSTVVAIEDNPDGVSAANAAGISTIGFTGANIDAKDMRHADMSVTSDLNDAVGATLGWSLKIAV